MHNVLDGNLPRNLDSTGGSSSRQGFLDDMTSGADTQHPYSPKATSYYKSEYFGGVTFLNSTMTLKVISEEPPSPGKRNVSPASHEGLGSDIQSLVTLQTPVHL